MSLSNLPDNSKWQQMLAIVNQNRDHVQTDLVKRYNKLFLSRLLAENTLVFLLQYIGLMLCTLGPNPTPLWLATGTACGFIFMRGYSVLPGIWLGSFCAYWSARVGSHIAIYAATIYALQAFLILYISYRSICPTLIYYKQSLLAKFLALTSIITALASFALVMTCYPTFSFPIWLQWWLANLTGIFVFSFALISLDAFFPQMEDLRETNKLSLAIYTLLIAIPLCLLIFSSSPITTITATLSLLVMLCLVSVRFGWCGAIVSLFVIGLTLDLASFLETALFTSANNVATLTYLQILLLIEIVIGLSIGIRQLSRQ